MSALFVARSAEGASYGRIIADFSYGVPGALRFEVAGVMDVWPVPVTDGSPLLVGRHTIHGLDPITLQVTAAINVVSNRYCGNNGVFDVCHEGCRVSDDRVLIDGTMVDLATAASTPLAVPDDVEATVQVCASMGDRTYLQFGTSGLAAIDRTGAWIDLAPEDPNAVGVVLDGEIIDLVPAPAGGEVQVVLSPVDGGRGGIARASDLVAGGETRRLAVSYRWYDAEVLQNGAVLVAELGASAGVFTLDPASPSDAPTDSLTREFDEGIGAVAAATGPWGFVATSASDRSWVQLVASDGRVFPATPLPLEGLRDVLGMVRLSDVVE